MNDRVFREIRKHDYNTQATAISPQARRIGGGGVHFFSPQTFLKIE